MAPKVTKRPAAAMRDDEEVEDVTGADLAEDAEEPGPETSPKKKPACVAKTMPKPKAKGKTKAKGSAHKNKKEKKEKKEKMKIPKKRKSPLLTRSRSGHRMMMKTNLKMMAVMKMTATGSSARQENGRE